MASKRAGQIVISLSAGTAQFVQDMERARVKVREFGSESTKSGLNFRYAFLGVKDIMEGRVNNAIAEGANELIRLRGAALAVGGSVAGIAVLGLAAYEANKYFKEMAEAPGKLRDAFRELNAPIQLVNDELQVTNDRLANDIAKLEGNRQNTLKLALDEARVAADKLAESLDKDLTGLNKLLKEQEIGFLGSFFKGVRTDDLRKELGGETGNGGFKAEIDKITDEGNAKIAAIAADGEAKVAAAKGETNKKLAETLALNAKTAAQTELNTRLTEKYDEKLAKLTARLAEARRLDKEHDKEVAAVGILGKTLGAQSPEAVNIEDTSGAIRNLTRQRSFVTEQAENTKLTDQKAKLEADKANAALGKPFADRLSSIQAQLQESASKLAGVGQSESTEVIFKAYGEAAKAITEVNKQLAEHNTKLSKEQEATIRSREVGVALTAAEADFRTKLSSTNDTLDDRIKSQKLLADAIGKGYEATRQANIETQLMATLGHDKYNDEATMARPETAALRGKISDQFDADHATQVAKTIEQLNTQISLERDLAAVQVLGAAAVQRVTQQYKLYEMALAGATTEELAAQQRAFDAEATNKTTASIAGLDEKIAATRRLTAATLEGAEASRIAGLENKYDEMRRNLSTPNDTPERTAEIKTQITKERTLDTTENQRKVTSEAAKTVTAYNDQLFTLNQEKQTLIAMRGQTADTVAVDLQLKDVEDQILKTEAQRLVAQGSLRDGMRAFMLDMQQQTEKPGKILYDGMHSAVDRLSGELTNLFTGAKTSFAQMFQDIGRQILNATIKSGIQTVLGDIAKRTAAPPGTTQAGQQQGGVLGTLGKIAGVIGGKSTGKQDGQGQSTALWVQIAGAQAAGPGAPTLPGAISIPGFPGFSIPGLNKDAGGFERGPNARTADQTPAQLKGVFDDLRKAIGVLPQFKAPVSDKSQFDKFRLPGGLVNRTGSAIDGVPSVSQPGESKPLSNTGPLAGLQEWLQRIEGTDTQILSTGTQGLNIDRTRSSDPTGKNGDPVYVNVVNQQSQQSSSGGLSGILGGLGGLLGGLGGAGGAGAAGATSSVASDATESVWSTIDFGGALASGGDVAAGVAHLVGEQGPELFIPTVGGSIIPNNKKNSWLSLLLGSGALSPLSGGSLGKSPLDSIFSFFGKGSTTDDSTKKESPWLSLLTSSGLTGGGLLGGGGNTQGITGLLGKYFKKGATATGGGFSSLLSSFGGFFAEGGDVPVGRAIVVGEKGPELLVPKSHGTVIPHDKTRAMLAGMGHKKPMVPFGGAREMGGSVSPSAAYLVGERGPELMMMTANNATSRSVSERSKGGGGGTHNYSVIVQGSGDREIYENTRRAITASHKAAVGTAVQANVERGRRVPQANR